MSFDAHTNFAYATVDTAPTPAASGTSLTVAVGLGALFPAAPFNAVIYPNGAVPLATNAEIVRVTLVVGDTFTITRTQEGTSARTILSGDQIAAAITVKTLTDVETAIPSIAGLISAINVSAGVTSQNLSAITFDNSNGVSFGLTGSVITATVATNYQSQGAYLTTAALSQDSSKYAGNNGAITGGSITVDTSGVSVNLPAYLTTGMASNRGSDFVQATAVFHGTNASGTIASGAISVSVAAAGAANINFSAGTTSNNLTQLSFKDTNGVSFGLNGGTLSATVKTDYQSSGAYLTTAMQSDAATISNINVSGGTTSSNLSALKFIDSQGVSWSLDTGSKLYATVKTDYQTSGNYLTTAMASNRGSDFVQAAAVFHGTNASGTIASGDISVSVNATVAQSNQTVGLYASSNTYLTSSGTVDARSLSFRGDKSITVGVSAGEVVFSVGAYLTTAALSQDSSKYAGTNGAITGGSITVNTSGVSVNLPAYLTTAMQSNAATISNINVSGGTTSSNLSAFKLIDSNGVSWSLDTGSKIYATVKTDYLTTAALSGDTSKYVQAWELTGNTAGTTSSLQGTKIYFSGGNSITVSGNSNTVVFSVGNYLTTAALSADSSKYAGTGFTSTTTAGTAIVGTHNTAGLSIGVPAYLTTAALSADSSKYAGTGFTSAGANISLSGTQNTAGLSLSASVAAQSNQSAIKAFGVSNTGQTAGNTGVSTGIDWVLAGSQSITLSQSTAVGGPNTVWFQHPAWLTTADLSANSSKYVQNWKLTGNTAGTTSSAQGTDLWFSGGNSITVSGNSNTIVFSVGAYLTTAALSADSSKYAGTGFTSAGNNIGLSGTQNTAGLSLSATVAAQTNQSLGLYMSSNTTSSVSSGTVDARSMTFRGVGIASVGYSGGEVIISVPSGGGGITNINVSAGTTSQNLSNVVFSNSGAISFGISGSTVTASANTTTYNTVGSATTVQMVGSANSLGTVTRWAIEDHVHAGIGAIGISTSGNSSGTSGSVQGTYWLQGGSNITVSQITSNNGSHTAVISGKNEGFVGMLEPYPLLTATQTIAPVAGSWYLAPFTAFGSMSGGRINLLVQNTGTANLFLDIGETAYVSTATGSIQQSYTYSGVAALFSQGTGANSTRLESLWSNSHSFGWSKVANVSLSQASNINISMAHSVSYISDIGSDGAYTNVQLAGAGSSTVANSSTASTRMSTVFSSGRNLLSGSLIQPIGFNTTISAGIYWLGFAWSSTRASASTGAQLSSGSDFSFGGLLGMSRLAVDSVYRNFGSTASTARSQIIPYGVYTAAANIVPPTNIALSSDLSSLASQWVPYFNFQVRGLTK